MREAISLPGLTQGNQTYLRRDHVKETVSLASKVYI